MFSLTPPDLGPWRAGNTGVEGVWHFDADVPGRRVMLSALVHGNELCGAWALKELLEAGVRPACGSLTLAFCNLDAFDHFDANNGDASRFVDEDMNRQWVPARLAQAGTRERRRAAALAPFVQGADWLLDLHSMHEPGLPLLLVGMHPRNLELARQLRAPAHVVVDAGHRDGVRMRDYGRFNEPDADQPDTRSLLVECGYHGDLASLDVARDQCARFLVTAGTLTEATAQRSLPGWQMPDAATQWALHVTDAVVARSEGFTFSQAFQGLEVIAKAGTVIGDNDGEPVKTPYDDCVLVMPSTRQARQGVTVVRFARRELLR
ncbi:succinylglutamate desuccinylase/aspartoacylase domain-containing protein [Hydrogenophaga palleronii]|uniref:succinylglutamate desuccinylase/aspartoacylase domain-containing protein n=1 Tax=Hydrogenophaga palleronii TaxID=65655 RepID=UPI000ABAC3A0|nr:succinylglutamate desuccinylase/aspartoacylase family protein [Hydrogenophaga palleronii]